MNIKTGVKFHNRFDIEVRDKDTGKLKQKAMAENIVLDRMYTRICNFSSYFSYIHFGTGTGTLDPSRTTLFSSLGNRSAAVEEKIKAYPVSKITRRIRLEPEEYIDRIITEVGVSETTSAINTHALIKDAEGNPLSIEKTELDVVIIYATVFIELQHPSENFRFINLPSGNSLINYFLDDTTPSGIIACDRNKEMSNTPSPVITQKTGSITVNAIDKTRNIKTRFGVSEANGNVRGIRVLDMLKVTLPHNNIYTGHDFEGVILGSGDGENKDFEIPNIYPEDIVVKKNGSITGDYQIKNNSLIEYKLQDLAGIGNNIGTSVAISQDGNTIITASNAAPLFTVQKLNENGTYDKLQDLTGIGDRGTGAAISPDGSTIITASRSAPLFTVQKLNENGTYDKLQNLTGVGNNGRGAAISPDCSTIITASYSAPLFTVQKLNENGTYDKLQDLTGIGDRGTGAAISSDGSTIITVSNRAPLFTVQKLNEAKRIIKFNTPPAIDDVITADYFVDYIPKSTDFVLDVDFTLQFGEGL